MPLYIVSTPIGNLGDITLRAIEILKSVDYILCEDTRVTGKLLHHLEIGTSMMVFNDFNEEKMILRIIADLTDGRPIAQVSDAGTPLVSDPGFKLVRECVSKGIKVEAVPGASAAISALTVSGLAPDKFLFLGFLPKKDGRRLELLKKTRDSINSLKSTVIIYESPFRVLKTLEQIKDVFGDIDIVVCRELTKMHEEVLRDKVSTLIPLIKPKGEFVILF